MEFGTGQQVLHLDLSDSEGPEYHDDDLARVGYRRKLGTKRLALEVTSGQFVKSK